MSEAREKLTLLAQTGKIAFDPAAASGFPEVNT
jgi:hypothetical protein